MSAIPGTRPLTERRRHGDRFGDRALEVLTGAAALAAVVLLGAIAWKIFDTAWPAMRKFGLGFLTHQVWYVNRGKFAALDFIWGTAVTSVLALAIAAPISIAIGLYLSELAPRGLRLVVGTLVELLAGTHSVV